MASLIDLRRRIRSVKNTQQITKAMKMVAAAKLRRAQDQILATRPYALELRKVTEHLAAVAAGEVEHPLLTPAGGGEDGQSADAGSGKTLVLVVTGGKGLCGAFNAHGQRRAEQEMATLNGGGRTRERSHGWKTAITTRRPSKVSTQSCLGRSAGAACRRC